MPSHLPRGTKSVIIDAIVGPKNTEPHYLPRGAKIGIMIGGITGLIIGAKTPLDVLGATLGKGHCFPVRTFAVL